MILQDLPNRSEFDSRYRIDSEIGSGGAGVVFAAFDSLLNRPVAIKRLRADKVAENSEDIENLLYEAEAICRVQHPNIVSVYDVGSDDDGVFIVMELLDGFDFQILAQDGYLMLEQFRELAIQSLEALVAAHSMGILHLDVKPANLILVWLPSGRLHVKIVDFGLAKISAKMETPGCSTRHLDLQGSIYFMSPEQMNRKPLDQRTDLYSLGCVFYYALTGKYPFDGDTTVQVMASHITHRVTDLRKHRPDLPVWLCEWVMNLFEKKAELRPESSLAALDAFLAFDRK